MSFTSAAFLFGAVCETSQIFWRIELQAINRHFEQRPWLKWSKESLERLNPEKLWQYHQAHEIPKAWWAWDYTLSWLIEHNHPPVEHKIVLFNHLLEDEPPMEAVKQFPWMKPLLRYPLSRATIAEIVEYLGKSGCRLIVLDNDFPQFTPQDKILAEAMHKCSTGQFGKPVPVLMVQTISRRSSNKVVQQQRTMPSGVIMELEKLEPGVDVTRKYTGITGIMPDEDQIVRRLAVQLEGFNGDYYESLVLKALRDLKEGIPESIPHIMDIDFASRPNSELYPVRPQSYLLDPQKRIDMINGGKDYHDVTLPGAIVFIGDSVTDVYSTPLTNTGLDEMSGDEILVHSLETIARRSWFTRVQGWPAVGYVMFICFLGGIFWVSWKSLQKSTIESAKHMTLSRNIRLLSDMAAMLLIIAASYLGACLLFTYSHLIVPVMVPALSIGIGAVAALMWEREREREETYHVKVAAAEEKLESAKQRYESDLKRQEAEAHNREILMDRQRRQEFVRRINHDLNAPVSVLNWTLSELQEEGSNPTLGQETITRLVKNSNKLCEFIDQLVTSYDYETALESNEGQAVICNMGQVVADTLDLQTPLAQIQESTLQWKIPSDPLFIRVNKLEFTRVVDNLVRNALKHNPSGTEVKVEMETHAGKNIVRIIDNGKGISHEHLLHIFEPGYRVNPEKKDGQGLGLDIVKTLIEKMGGTISVESTVGKGTTFTVSVPSCHSPEDNGEHK